MTEWATYGFNHEPIVASLLSIAASACETFASLFSQLAGTAIPSDVTIEGLTTGCI